MQKYEYADTAQKLSGEYARGVATSMFLVAIWPDLWRTSGF